MLHPKSQPFLTKKLILVVIISALAGSILLPSPQPANPKINENNLFQFPDLFQKNQPTNTTKETIKVVSEQSQVIKVVKQASPAVVSIIASAEVPTFETYFSDPFSDFGGRGLFNFQIPQRRQNGTTKKQIGAGTGFLVSADGYIVTNKHVVAETEAEYTVYLNTDKAQGEKIIAKVIARDPNTDLAILKIKGKDLPFLEFGDTQNLEVGQTAITIGYALGEFDNTVSKGVISGLARSIRAGNYGRGSENLKNLIQTDAAINPGNSGGPMLNLEAQVIGVNVAMAQAENIGFAIPGQAAQKSFEEAKKTGKIKKIEQAFLGIRYLIINEELKKTNDLKYNYGALIIRGKNQNELAVIPGSPADKAGLVENDIILEIGGKKINNRQRLSDLISTFQPGQTIKLKISHRGQLKTVNITLETAD